MLKIIKAETSLGSNNKGTELAPISLLKNGLLDALKYNKTDYKILRLEPKEKIIGFVKNPRVKNHKLLTEFNHSIYNTSIKNREPEDKILLLGGDHSVSIGSMFATKKSEPKAVLVYIDAHADSNTPESSLSANMHGMSLSTILGDSLYQDYNLNKYKYSEVIILGAKDIDPPEWKYLRDKKIKVYAMNNIITEGIGSIMNKIISLIKDKPLHISLDIDSIDVSEAPGTGIVNKGGLTYREIKYITETLSTADIKSIDLIEINPKNDVGRKTIDLGIELVINLLGGKWSPYEKYLNKSK